MKALLFASIISFSLLLVACRHSDRNGNSGAPAPTSDGSVRLPTPNPTPAPDANPSGDACVGHETAISRIDPNEIKRIRRALMADVGPFSATNSTEVEHATVQSARLQEVLRTNLKIDVLVAFVDPCAVDDYLDLYRKVFPLN